MALTKISTDGFKDDAVTTDKLANAINTERTANTAKDLTSLSASNLTSGTIPDARLPATLPAASAANLTSIPAANITGTLPAISGANLTNLPASGKATNLVINGAMVLAQYGTSSTDGGYRTVDRFRVDYGGHEESPTIQQVPLTSGTSYDYGFRNALKITNGNQYNGASASDYTQVLHKIEAQDIANSGWNYTSTSSYITLSFWVKSSVAQVFSGSLRSQDGTGQSYKFDTPSLSANTWTKVTKTISGNSNLTFDNNTDNGLEIYLFPFIGTTYTSSNSNTETWITAATDGYANDMTSTWWTTNDATFEITGFLLEVNNTASDYPHESYQDTLLKCQRYHYAHKGPLWGEVSAGDHLDVALYFPVPMRTSPTFNQVDTSIEYKNRLNQGNKTSTNIYSVSGGTNAYGAMWVARPSSGSWDTQDGRHHYWHPPTGNTSYSWNAEL